MKINTYVKIFQSLESSSDDEPPQKNTSTIVQVPKKRPHVSSDAESSSNQISFPTLPKKRKYTYNEDAEEKSTPPLESETAKSTRNLWHDFL